MNRKITKIDIITRPSKLEDLKDALNKIGVHGMTVSQVYDYGTQRGHKEVYRRRKYEVNLVPKILACKFRCSMASVKKKYSKGGKFSIPYTSTKGETKYIEFYNRGFCKKQVLRGKSIDIMPPEPSKYMYAIKAKELVGRLLQNKCDYAENWTNAPKCTK